MENSSYKSIKDLQLNGCKIFLIKLCLRPNTKKTLKIQKMMTQNIKSKELQKR